MRRPADFKHFNLSQSEQAMIKKWSRLIVAVYVTLAVVGVAATLATGGYRNLDNVTAQHVPAPVSVDRN